MKTMKMISLLLLLTGSSFLATAQSDTVSQYIFIPHPRSDDHINQSVLRGIEQIDFSAYNMILLGGDLTYYTSIDRISMDYCDSLFNLGDPNTLWTMGNHDLTNQNLVEDYTGRPSYYPHTNENNITFLVLDTELDASGFASSHISGDQLLMIESVCDTIAHADYLILLHHRLLWMIGNDYFGPFIDSVAQSTRQLDTSNFNAVVYPLLQLAKSRGVQVICLGGDRSMINISYSPEDSITFITSTMVPEFTDAQNDVTIFSYNAKTNRLTWEFVPLGQVKKNPSGISVETALSPDPLWNVRYDRALSVIEVEFYGASCDPEFLEVYGMTGQLVFSELAYPGRIKTIPVRKKGLYFVNVIIDGKGKSRKICVY